MENPNSIRNDDMSRYCSPEEQDKTWEEIMALVREMELDPSMKA